MAQRITLVEAPERRAICEDKMRFIVKLDGKKYSELYYNMKGYRGHLPLPKGLSLDIGEKSISVYRKVIAELNREFGPLDIPANKARLEELRLVLRAESISYSELAELQSLSDYIGDGDVELLEAAGVPEEEARATGRI